jgi:hypothetical protein
MGMTERPHDHQASDNPASGPAADSRNLPAVPPAPWRLFLFMALLLAGIFAVFWQFHQQLNTLESRLVLNASGGERLQAMGQQMNLLRDRLHGLMADSVEIRLKSLERSIAAGKVSGDDLMVFQTLQRDLQSLESYARTPGSPGLDFAIPEHPRYQAAGMAAGAMLASGDLLGEISRLRTLLYLCLTGVLAAGGLVAGRYWVGFRKPTVLPRMADTPALLGGQHSSEQS